MVVVSSYKSVILFIVFKIYIYSISNFPAHGVSVAHACVKSLPLSGSSHLIVGVLVVVEECSRGGDTFERQHHTVLM